jgi:hypothetical protein
MKTDKQTAVKSLIEADAVTPLVSLLASKRLRLVESSARALRVVFQSSGQTHLLNTLQCKSILSLLSLAQDLSFDVYAAPQSSQTEPSSVRLRITEIAACIVARIAQSIKSMCSQDLHSIVIVLMQYLNPQFFFYPKLQEAVLDALASLCKEWPEFTRSVLGCKGVF